MPPPPATPARNGHPAPARRGAAADFLLPHHRTFTAVFNQTSRLYRWTFDEALRDSAQNALAMGRDGYLLALRQERALAVAHLPWTVESDDKKDPQQKVAAQHVTAVLKAMPNFFKMRYYLLFGGVWQGRYGAQLVWGPKQIGGVNRLAVLRHKPVNGDKIQYDVDANPCVMVNSQWAAEIKERRPDVYDRAFAEDREITTRVLGDRAPMLRLADPLWRQRFVIHQHELEDADYFEGELAGGVHGVGLRHRLYWLHWMRQEMMAWAVTAMERAGVGGVMVFPYPDGSAEGKSKAEEQAKASATSTAFAVPVPMGQDPKNYAPLQIAYATGGVEVLQGMISDYFERHEERLVVGQSMSSGNSRSDGLGSARFSELAENTKYQIIKSDAENLGETLTNDLVAVVRRYNLPACQFPLYFRIAVPDPDAEKKLEAAKVIFDMGLPLKTEELYQAAGFTPPQDDDEVTGMAGESVVPGQEPFGQGGAFGDDDGPPDGFGGEEQGDGKSVSYAWNEADHPRDGGGRFTDIPAGEMRTVGGFKVRRTGDAEWRVETRGGKGHVTGDAATVQAHIDRETANQRAYGRQLRDALSRAGDYDEPSFMDGDRLDAAGKAFAKLPAGAAVVSLEDSTYGRTGRIVKDEAGANRVRLDGEDGYASNHVEPLDPKHSWRAPAAPAAPRPTQGVLFQADGIVRYDAGRWVTIGGAKGEDGKRKGGSPVFIQNGRITKGHPSLAGKKIGALKDDADTSHRSELKQSREYARAKHAKAAKADGIDPSDLHQLADEIKAHHAAFAAERKQLLKDARDALGEFGGQAKALHLMAGRGKDAGSVKGIDEVAEGLAERYPALFPPHQHASDTLYEMLTDGTPNELTDDEAYDQAAEQLRHHAEKGWRRNVPSNEPIPFASPAVPLLYADDGSGRWVTIGAKGPEGEKSGGTPVYITSDGTIARGPAGLVGKAVGELGRRKRREAREDAHALMERRAALEARMAGVNQPPEARRDPTAMEAASGDDFREPGVGKPGAPGRFGHPPEPNVGPQRVEKPVATAEQPAAGGRRLVQDVVKELRLKERQYGRLVLKKQGDSPQAKQLQADIARLDAEAKSVKATQRAGMKPKAAPQSPAKPPGGFDPSKSYADANGKEPWQLTARQWSDARDSYRWDDNGSGPTPTKSRATANVVQVQRLSLNLNPQDADTGMSRRVTHRDVIEAALKAGKDIPAEVLAEYPDLAPHATLAGLGLKAEPVTPETRQAAAAAAKAAREKTPFTTLRGRDPDPTITPGSALDRGKTLAGERKPEESNKSALTTPPAESKVPVSPGGAPGAKADAGGGNVAYPDWKRGGLIGVKAYPAGHQVVRLSPDEYKRNADLRREAEAAGDVAYEKDQYAYKVSIPAGKKAEDYPTFAALLQRTAATHPAAPPSSPAASPARPADRPATQRQIDYLHALNIDVNRAVRDHGHMTASFASWLIELHKSGNGVGSANVYYKDGSN